MEVEISGPNPDQLLQQAQKWDEKAIFGQSSESADRENVPIRGSYRDLFDVIQTLEAFRFTPYFNDEVQDFYGKLWTWLQQFETDEEKQLAFKIVSRITFITEDQIRQLQTVCYQERIRYRLLDRLIAERGLAAYSYDTAMKYYDEQLNQCLLVPLTDSARYNQFVHLNGLEDHSRLGLSSLQVFVHPDIRANPDVVRSLNQRYRHKRVLIVIEDFCGSGKTFSSDLARIAVLYPCFETVYFCPYVITERAEKALQRAARMWAPQVNFEVLYGMRLSNRMRCFSRSSVLFSYGEQRAIKELCLKYHDRYFKTNRYIGTPRSYPFGYRNGQLLVVLQSNCPNHTLPIIWDHDNGWFPLFRRIQRYA